MEREFSAGGVCVRRMRGRDWMAAVRVTDGTALALPKGWIDGGDATWPPPHLPLCARIASLLASCTS